MKHKFQKAKFQSQLFFFFISGILFRFLYQQKYQMSINMINAKSFSFEMLTT